MTTALDRFQDVSLGGPPLTVDDAAWVLVHFAIEALLPTEDMDHVRAMVILAKRFTTRSTPADPRRREARGLRLLAHVAHDVALYQERSEGVLQRFHHYRQIVAAAATAADNGALSAIAIERRKARAEKKAAHEPRGGR